MEILKIIETLQSYSEDVVAYKLDRDFAHAVSEAVALLVAQGERIAELEEQNRFAPDLHVEQIVFGHNCCEVVEYTVSEIRITIANRKYYRFSNHNSDFCLSEQEIGIVVFLTRDEAEAALRRTSDGN